MTQDEKTPELDVAMSLVSSMFTVRAKAIECMTTLALYDRVDSVAYQLARNLESDAQRIMHGRFEM